MPATNKAELMSIVCEALAEQDFPKASELAKQHLPWSPYLIEKRTYSKTEALRTFLRDGFVDRYFGSRLSSSQVKAWHRPAIACRAKVAQLGSLGGPAVN